MIEVDYRARDTFLFAYITDISAMGIFVRTNAPAEPGTHLQLRLHARPAATTSPSSSRARSSGSTRLRDDEPEEESEANARNPGMGIAVRRPHARREGAAAQDLIRTFAYLDETKPDKLPVASSSSRCVDRRAAPLRRLRAGE